jgi:hypothetical protein
VTIRHSLLNSRRFVELNPRDNLFDAVLDSIQPVNAFEFSVRRNVKRAVERVFDPALNSILRFEVKPLRFW